MMRRWMGCRLFLCATSLRCRDAPWVGIPAGTRVATTSTARPRRERSTARRSMPSAQRPERSTPVTWRVPSSRSGQLQPLNGVQRARDQRQTPTGGLDRGRRDSSTPPGPARAACGEQSQIRVGSIPSWGPSGERIIPTVRPGQQGPCPRDFYGGKPRKIQTTQLLSTAPKPD